MTTFITAILYIATLAAQYIICQQCISARTRAKHCSSIHLRVGLLGLCFHAVVAVLSLGYLAIAWGSDYEAAYPLFIFTPGSLVQEISSLAASCIANSADDDSHLHGILAAYFLPILIGFVSHPLFSITFAFTISQMQNILSRSDSSEKSFG